MRLPTGGFLLLAAGGTAVGGREEERGGAASITTEGRGTLPSPWVRVGALAFGSWLGWGTRVRGTSDVTGAWRAHRSTLPDEKGHTDWAWGGVVVGRGPAPPRS
jgi:hypothetical protein